MEILASAAEREKTNKKTLKTKNLKGGGGLYMSVNNARAGVQAREAPRRSPPSPPHTTAGSQPPTPTFTPSDSLFHGYQSTAA